LCKEQAKEYLASVQSILSEWTDATKLVTNPIQASIVDTFQAIRRKAETLNPPQCAQFVQTNLVLALDSYISVIWIALTPQASYDKEFGQYIQYFYNVTEAIKKINQ
jgi:hypothetical protein